MMILYFLEDVVANGEFFEFCVAHFESEAVWVAGFGFEW
jgi:hypothetical protein